MELPTVCVVNPSAKSGFTRINESDFDPKVHSIYGEAPAPAVEPVEPVPAPVVTGTTPTPSSAFVAKGPRGLWFVMNGEDSVSKGFKSEAEAYAAMEG